MIEQLDHRLPTWKHGQHWRRNGTTGSRWLLFTKPSHNLREWGVRWTFDEYGQWTGSQVSLGRWVYWQSVRTTKIPTTMYVPTYFGIMRSRIGKTKPEWRIKLWGPIRQQERDEPPRHRHGRPRRRRFDHG